jgi:putative transposase
MATAGTRIGVPVAVACRVLKLSRQAYYQWLVEPVCQRDWDDAHAINVLREIHEDDPTLGYRFLTDELGDVGITASENRVWRLCQAAGVFASHHRRRAKARKPGPPVHDDLLAFVDEHGVTRHDFTATGPDQKWLNDISEHPTGEGKLYLCAVKDWRFQGASATLLMSSFSFSRGVWNPSVFRGRSLSWSTMASMALSVTLLKSVPLG